MILTLTVNPAIDRNLTVDQLVFEDRAYILSSEESCGGRGINASYVIHSFGGKTRAICTVGGESGERLKKYLSQCGFPVDTVPVNSNTRTNLNISDRNGLTIKLNERGMPLDPEEVAAVQAAVVRRLPESSWLMLCGSLPPGVPADFYAQLIEQAKRSGVRTLLDTDGEPLQLGLEAQPTVVAPNQPEAERLLNKVLLTRIQILEAAERIRLMGPEMVVLSIGSRGAVGAREGHIIEAIPPRIDVGSPIGAGDALAASFVWAMRLNDDFADALRWGVAAGTASAMKPGVSFASFEQTKVIYQQVQIRDNLR
ncbi:MAG: 1-phosphofructokinase family hexose kinase [Bryobacteraceae bacterium]|nr:1-phosphofructokinase family hexose kinase [Bryobacteraceae bacterium]MDW8379858.1 1-phosphofructokinase family hexose kinase [Bryobacterales bacterium]